MSVAVIGGSGVEAWPGATVAERRAIATRYGAPSTELQRIELGGASFWFLSRHGRGHDIAPHRVNYRANIDALCQCGCETVIALNAVGIVGDEAAPGELILPHQLIDYTWGRASSFFDGDANPLEHVDVTVPFDAELRAKLLRSAGAAGVKLVDGAVYGVTQGPRLETAAEVDRLARDGVDIIGMTAMPEAALAMERALAYASVGLVVNRAAGRGDTPIHDALALAMTTARERAAELVLSFLCQQD